MGWGVCVWFFRVEACFALQGCKWKHPNWRSHLLSPGPPRRSHPPRSAQSWCNGRAQWERCLGVKFGDTVDGRNPVITAWDIENPVNNGINYQQKTAAWFLPSTVWRGNDGSWMDSFPHWIEGKTTWNYSEGGMVPIHPSCIQQGIYLYPHPIPSRFIQKSWAAKVVYTQVGASIKETVRGHSRQIELCSVTWWRWCAGWPQSSGVWKKVGWIGWRSWILVEEIGKVMYIYIYIWTIYVYLISFIFSPKFGVFQVPQGTSKKGLGLVLIL